MGKRVFKSRACVSCGESFTPTGPKNRWCSLVCRLTDQIDSSAGTDACWPWTASIDKNGYGEIRINHETYFAHRIALSVLGGVPVKDTEVVRHNCDNPICCNPRHLIAGTQSDNVRDMIERGRQQDYSAIPRGERHGCAKITREQAISIFNATGGGHRKIAKRLGVSYDIVRRIKLGRSWSDVTGAMKTLSPYQIANAKILKV